MVWFELYTHEMMSKLIIHVYIMWCGSMKDESLDVNHTHLKQYIFANIFLPKNHFYTHKYTLEWL